tara:strand:+ start:180 stop:425 length:246 start_codon:yes stop_codon:yes gene_type:complete
MFCYRCAQVFVTERIACVSCGFLLVGVTLDDDGSTRLRTPPDSFDGRGCTDPRKTNSGLFSLPERGLLSPLERNTTSGRLR